MDEWLESIVLQHSDIGSLLGRTFIAKRVVIQIQDCYPTVRTRKHFPDRTRTLHQHRGKCSWKIECKSLASRIMPAS